MATEGEWILETVSSLVKEIHRSLDELVSSAPSTVSAFFTLHPAFLLPSTWPERDQRISSAVAFVTAEANAARKMNAKVEEELASVGNMANLQDFAQRWEQLGLDVEYIDQVITTSLDSASSEFWDGWSHDEYVFALLDVGPEVKDFPRVAEGMEEALVRWANAISDWGYSAVESLIGLLSAVLSVMSFALGGFFSGIIQALWTHFEKVSDMETAIQETGAAMSPAGDIGLWPQPKFLR